jgi:hypothetical protein
VSIRLRRVNGCLVALCAARSVEKPGDLYLDDNAHHALAAKFSRDFREEGCFRDWDPPMTTPDEDRVVETEESGNPNRDEWDRSFGPTRVVSDPWRVLLDAALCQPTPTAELKAAIRGLTDAREARAVSAPEEGT